jgi:hypothetical protein
MLTMIDIRIFQNQVSGNVFQKCSSIDPPYFRHKSILDAVDLPTPPWERETTGFWIDLPTSVLDALRSSDINSAEAIHAAEHAFLNHFPLSEDLKTDCRVVQEDNKDSPVKRYPRYDSILQKATLRTYWTRDLYSMILWERLGALLQELSRMVRYSPRGKQNAITEVLLEFSASDSD